MAKATTPHFAVPFRMDGSRGSVVTEQDSEEEILDCIEVILRYPQGHRPEKPEFGIPDLTFMEHADERLIQEALDEWEPRIEMSVGQSIVDKIDVLIQTIRVQGVS